MARKTILEQRIRKSFQVISESENILQTSENPKEKARARRTIKDQLGFMEGDLQEYISLCERMGLAMPKDIAMTAGGLLPQYQSFLSLNVNLPEGTVCLDSFDTCSSRLQDKTEELEQTRSSSVQLSLEELKDTPKRYLCGLFLVLLLSLIITLDGVGSFFDIPPCPRRLGLTILTFIGGMAILGFSFLPRYRSHYQNWDRRFTIGLLVVTTGVLCWLVYRVCMLSSQIPKPYDLYVVPK